MNTQAITVTTGSVENTSPRVLVILPPDLQEQIDSLTARASVATVTDVTSKAQAEALAKELRAVGKQVKDARLSATRPLDAVIGLAIDLEKSALARIDAAWSALTKAADTWTREENARREKERQAVEAERARLQKIADEAAEAERARLQALADLDAPPGEAAAPIPVTEALPVAVPERYVPPPMALSTKRKTTYDLEVIDGAKCPITSPDGRLLRPIDNGEVISWLKSLAPEQRAKQEEVCGVRLLVIEGRGAKA